MPDKEGMEKKKRDPDQDTLFQRDTLPEKRRKEMESFKNRFLRVSRTWTDILPLTLLPGYLWMFVGTILTGDLKLVFGNIEPKVLLGFFLFVFRIDAASDGFFFDTGFGVEGSWGAVIVISIVIAVLIFMYKGKEKNDLRDGWVDPEKIRKEKTLN